MLSTEVLYLYNTSGWKTLKKSRILCEFLVGDKLVRVILSLFLFAIKMVAGEISEVFLPMYRITLSGRHIFVRTYPAFVVMYPTLK